MRMEETFKLEAVLKLKKFAESKEKAKMGKILGRINEEKSRIVFLDEELDQIHHYQSTNLEAGMDSKLLRSYPMAMQALEKEVQSCKKKLVNLERDYEEASKRLRVIMGEVEVLQRMEESHKESWKKKINIKKEQDIEDIVNMRRRE